jgi:uncharacterized cupredoxin-like copper-binding protein
MRRERFRLVVIIACAAIVLGVVSAVGVAAAIGGRRPAQPWTSACPTPALSGAVADVTLTDMGGMMRPGMMGPGMMGPGMMGNGPFGRGSANNGYAWQNGYPWPEMGMMRISVVPPTVPAGTVSLRVHNSGALTHEVIVLPLGSGQYPGQRAIGTDGRVDESGSLGEASRSCGADEGDGILAGANSWTTINLPPGRYELLCNITGHYGAGMYAELDAVTR